MTPPATLDALRPGATAHRMRSRIALLWLVLALLVQGFATQTHFHFGADSSQPSARTVVTVVERQKPTPAAPACPLCEEKALFGAYLLGGSVTLAPPVAAVAEHSAVPLPAIVVRLASHAWRSRAPPLPTN